MKIELVPALLSDLDPRAQSVSRGIALGFNNFSDGETAVRDVLTTIEKAPRSLPWRSYWASCPDENAYVGLCAFKAPPDAAAEVEIAYYTFPRIEGHGIATQMAALQVTIARSHGLKTVRAHTLPELNASGTVLNRVGFTHIGAALDPEDGPVWAWVCNLVPLPQIRERPLLKL